MGRRTLTSIAWRWILPSILRRRTLQGGGRDAQARTSAMAASSLLASRLAWVLLGAGSAAVAGCGSDDERLGELVDACLEREKKLGHDLSACRDELEGAVSALSGEGRPEGAEPAPLLPMRARVRRGRAGDPPELEFRARNEGGRTVASFRFRARLFDAFDEPVRCDTEDNEGVPTCRPGAEEYRDAERIVIEPSRSERVVRTLPDFERATKAIVTIYEVSFDGGERWRGSAVGYPAPPIRTTPDPSTADGGALRPMPEVGSALPALGPLPAVEPLRPAPSPRASPSGRSP